MKNLIVEFHCHTIYSKDSLMTPETLLKMCRKRGIDKIIVTDHNTIRGALAAKALDPERVIVGEEIMTSKGELLAAFLEEEIPAGLSPQETIRLLREQNAFISVAHPFDAFRSGHWDTRELLEILPLVDAIETFNARCLWGGFNRRARQFAEIHHLSGTVGSDAHAAFEVGRATLSLPPFEDAESLRRAIRNSIPRTRLSAPWAHLFSRYAVFRKRKNPSLDMENQP
jgi:predicted metal-dependent phosphoesterase TrpH